MTSQKECGIIISQSRMTDIETGGEAMTEDKRRNGGLTGDWSDIPTTEPDDPDAERQEVETDNEP